MDEVDTPKKEIQDMNVAELIGAINGTMLMTALSLGCSDFRRLTRCVQEIKNIKLRADKDRLQEAFDIIDVTFRVMSILINVS